MSCMIKNMVIKWATSLGLSEDVLESMANKSWMLDPNGLYYVSSLYKALEVSVENVESVSNGVPH